MTAALTATWDPALARIVLTASGLNVATARTEILRWEAGEPPTIDRAAVVRGSDLGAATSGVAYDYEFAPGVANRYALYNYEADGSGIEVVSSDPQDTVPVLDGVWLKSIARPFLNRIVTVHDYSDVARPARGGVFEVIGRRDRVAVTEVRGSREFELTLKAATLAEVDEIETFLSFGDVVLLQPPAGSPVPGPMYAWVGDLTRSKGGRHTTELRFLTLPLTEVAAPDPAVVGYTVTWAGVVAAWASWDDVLDDPDVPTWADLSQYVSDPEDEIVG